MPSSARKFFFIGAGNMGGSILCTLAENGYPARSLFFFEQSDEQAKRINEKSKATRVNSLAEGFSKADLIFLCIKPQVFSKISNVLRSEIEKFDKNFIIVSIMAGVSIATLKAAFPKNKQVVRTMPNIVISVKKGVFAIATEGVDEETLRTIEFFFSMCADTVRVSEMQMDAVTGLSGSGPAFVFQFVDALAMGGVKAGLQRDIAMKLALSTVAGSVEMLKGSNLSPSELAAKICSPAGTTIAGIHELESRAFKGTVMAAVEASAKRSEELGKDLK